MKDSKRRQFLEEAAKASPVTEKGVRWDFEGSSLVSRFRDPRVFQEFLFALRDANIRYSIRTQRWEALVFVGEKSRERAFDLLGEIDRVRPRSTRRPVRKRYDVFFWYVLVGIAMFLPFYSVSIRVAGAFLGLWIGCGLLIDRAVLSFRWRDSYRLGIVDALLLVGCIAAFLQMLGLPN